MQDAEYVKQAFAAIAPKYVATNHILSLGIDLLWRKRVVALISEWKPKDVLDVATGTGDLALAIQHAMPEVILTGTDFCQPMLDVAASRGLKNLVCADALELPFPNESFDLVTIAFGLRNMVGYEKALREMKRILRPGGHLLVLDFSLPSNFLCSPYRWYLHKILPKIAGKLTGNSDAYQYLGKSIEQFPRGQKMQSLWESVGFKETTHEPLSAGIAAIYTGIKR